MRSRLRGPMVQSGRVLASHCRRRHHGERDRAGRQLRVLGLSRADAIGSDPPRAKDGGAAEVLAAEGVLEMRGLALDSTHVYWVNNWYRGTVQRVPRAGGATETVLGEKFRPVWVATVSGGFVWSASNSDGTVPLVGMMREGVVTNFTAAVDTAWELTTDATHVYFFTHDGDVRRVSMGGGAVETVATKQEPIMAIAVDDGHVYWSTWGPHASGSYKPYGKIFRAPKTGGASAVVADKQTAPVSLALDETHVYWTNIASGEVVRARKSGGSVLVLARGQSMPHAIALDAREAYWVNSNTGRPGVFAIPK